MLSCLILFIVVGLAGSSNNDYNDYIRLAIGKIAAAATL
jgi:hypothetical protein